MLLDNMDMLESYDSNINPIEESIWICRDGTEIAIENMTDNHIINSVRMIKRSIRNGRPWRIEYLSLFKEELIHRAYQRAVQEEINKLVSTNDKFRNIIQTLKNI